MNRQYLYLAIASWAWEKDLPPGYESAYYTDLEEAKAWVQQFAHHDEALIKVYEGYLDEDGEWTDTDQDYYFDGEEWDA